MRFLALDTATPDASVALRDLGGHTVAEASTRVTTHSEALLALVDRVLSRAASRVEDLGAVVCGAGPGSFTGLRIGMATAKGICFAARKPLCCVSSLDALGQAGAAIAGADRLVVALIDARRGQVYARRYRGGRPLIEPSVGTIEHVTSELSGTEPLFIGDGAQCYRAEVERLVPASRWAPDDAHQIRASWLAVAAEGALRAREFASVDEAVPIYLREPDIRPAANTAPRSD